MYRCPYGVGELGRSMCEAPKKKCVVRCLIFAMSRRPDGPAREDAEGRGSVLTRRSSCSFRRSITPTCTSQRESVVGTVRRQA